MSRDVVVIGGGPAGASAALQLALRGYDCVLLEKQCYPAHKLCGEFLSVEAAGLFDRLGVLADVRAAGAVEIGRTEVTTEDGASFRCDLPGRGLGLSRHALDALLFAAARAAGADARDGTAVREVTGSLDEGFTVRTHDEVFDARVVVGAYGKRGLLDRKLGRPFLDEKAPFVAFKGHFEGEELDGTVELHAFDGGYCGLSPVEGGRVNACWIARERVLREAGGDPEEMVGRALRRNGRLAARLAAMRRVSDSFLAVSQVSFARKGCFDADVCMVGDTAAMIAPLCGDGMSMALHAAELAVPPVAAFLDGRLPASGMRATYARAWEREFRGRLHLGRLIHYGYVHPRVAAVGVRVLARLPGLAPWLIRRTRGTVGR